jgi:hypothetical protein
LISVELVTVSLLYVDGKTASVSRVPIGGD